MADQISAFRSLLSKILFFVSRRVLDLFSKEDIQIRCWSSHLWSHNLRGWRFLKQPEEAHCSRMPKHELDMGTAAPLGSHVDGIQAWRMCCQSGRGSFLWQARCEFCRGCSAGAKGTHEPNLGVVVFFHFIEISFCQATDLYVCGQPPRPASLTSLTSPFHVVRTGPSACYEAG